MSFEARLLGAAQSARGDSSINGVAEFHAEGTAAASDAGAALGSLAGSATGSDWGEVLGSTAGPPVVLILPTPTAPSRSARGGP